MSLQDKLRPVTFQSVIDYRLNRIESDLAEVKNSLSDLSGILDKLSATQAAITKSEKEQNELEVRLRSLEKAVAEISFIKKLAAAALVGSAGGAASIVSNLFPNIIPK